MVSCKKEIESTQSGYLGSRDTRLHNTKGLVSLESRALSFNNLFHGSILKSIYKFPSYFSNRQTDAGYQVASSADVIIYKYKHQS